MSKYSDKVARRRELAFRQGFIDDVNANITQIELDIRMGALELPEPAAEEEYETLTQEQWRSNIKTMEKRIAKLEAEAYGHMKTITDLTKNLTRALKNLKEARATIEQQREFYQAKLAKKEMVITGFRAAFSRLKKLLDERCAGD